MITLSEGWKAKMSQACVGLLHLVEVSNARPHPALTAAREVLEGELKERFGSLDRKSLRELPVFSAYDSFYRDFKKTYHVQLQLESVALQGKSINSPSALVECMFMAELKTGLLTAGHDCASVVPPLEANVAAGGESYQRMDGSSQQLKEGDLFISDQSGILSSVIYGPDQRTRITGNTREVIFTTYGPPGISVDLIEEELILLEGYIKLIAPAAIRRELIVL